MARVPVSKNAEAAQPDAADPAGAETEVVAPKRPTCSPEQKVKVTNAINAYVAAAQGDAAIGPPQAAHGRPKPRGPTPAAPIDTFRHSRVDSGAKLEPVRL